MEPSWRQLRRFRNRALIFGIAVAAMYSTGAGILALAAWHHDIGLGTVAIMLPMFPTTMTVGGVSAADVTLENMLASVPDLDELLSRLRPAAAEIGRASAAGMPARSIRFESVGYRYPGGGQPVYQDLDLELAAGESLALVGVNGAGKTTLVTLLARLREPTGGRITVDGTDLRDLDPRSWQRQVAVVNQDFGRYPLSARENVAFGDLTADGLADDFDEAVLERAAAQAGALDFIRALYAAARGARVLVLDEPTAQLDIRAEAAFYDRFLELTSGLTTMVISHRFATVRRAERIAVLEAGRITELGRHDELVAAGGSYAEMFTLQAASGCISAA
jgi:ATP-binding cassette subfamily B protein